MAKPEKEQSWWTTIPGMLTALGTFIGAITGLILALNQIGLVSFKAGTQETIPDTFSETGDPYRLGTVRDHEIDKIMLNFERGLVSDPDNGTPLGAVTQLTLLI